jgi:hypothetical protein
MDYNELLKKYVDLLITCDALHEGIAHAAQTIAEQTDLLEKFKKQLLESQAKIKRLEGQDMPC